MLCCKITTFIELKDKKVFKYYLWILGGKISSLIKDKILLIKM